MSAIPLRQQTARTGIISGLMVSTMDLLHRGLSRNNNKLQEEIPAGTHCREDIVSSMKMSNFCIIGYCTLVARTVIPYNSATNPVFYAGFGHFIRGKEELES